MQEKQFYVLIATLIFLVLFIFFGNGGFYQYFLGASHIIRVNKITGHAVYYQVQSVAR